MAQLRRRKSDFEARGARIAAVSPAEGASARSVCEMFGFPFPCLGDPSGEAYDAYGLARGNIGRMISPRSIWRGAKAYLGGYRQGLAIGDRFRLPGAFIIGPDGMIRWAWHGRDASGHPAAADILSALDETEPA